MPDSCLARLRTDLTTKAIVQGPIALAAAGVAFLIYENPTLFEFAIGVVVGAAFAGAGSGWTMWLLHRKPLTDNPEISPFAEGSVHEPARETRRHQLVRIPLYLVLDAAVIAVFAIIGAGFLVAAAAVSLLLAWRLTAWEERSNAALFYERRKAWRLRSQRPYWYFKPL